MPATAAKTVPVRSAGTSAASHQALTGTSLIGVSDEFTNAGLAASHSAANNPVPGPLKSRPSTKVNHTVKPARTGTDEKHRVRPEQQTEARHHDRKTW